MTALEDSSTEEAILAFARDLASRVEWLSRADISDVEHFEAAIEAAYERRYDQSGTNVEEFLEEVERTMRSSGRESIADFAWAASTVSASTLDAPTTDFYDVRLAVERLYVHIEDETAPDDERRRAARWLHGVSRLRRNLVDDGRCLDSLVDPVVRPFLLDVLLEMVGGAAGSDVEALVESDDPDDRYAALVYLSASKRTCPGIASLIEDALDQGGEHRTLAIRALWGVNGNATEALDRFLELTSSSDPVVRVGALNAAASHLWSSGFSPGVDDWELGTRVPELCLLLARALDDLHVDVRRRAAGLLCELEPDTTVLKALDPDTRWRFVTAIAAASVDSDEAIVDRLVYRGHRLFWTAVELSNEPIPVAARKGWLPASTSNAARVAIAAIVDTYPESVRAYHRVSADVVDRGEPTEADCRILQTLHEWATQHGDTECAETTREALRTLERRYTELCRSATNRDEIDWTGEQ